KYRTLLHLAVSRGDKTLVTFLLRRGADPNMQGKYYRDTFLNAVMNGNVETVRLFIEMGVDPHVSVALHWASYGRNLEIVHLLLDNGADPTIQGDNLRVVFDFKDQYDFKDEKGITALHSASFKGNLEIVQLLLEKGAEPNIQDVGGQTALHGASYNGHVETVQLLLQKGSDPNIQGGNFLHGLPLYKASSCGHLAIVQLLLEKTADPTIQGDNHFSITWPSMTPLRQQPPDGT
ncbi:ankyrin repeat-containing domain protein, partial [Mycena rebaudengoi]